MTYMGGVVTNEDKSRELREDGLDMYTGGLWMWPWETYLIRVKDATSTRGKPAKTWAEKWKGFDYVYLNNVNFLKPIWFVQVNLCCGPYMIGI